MLQDVRLRAAALEEQLKNKQRQIRDHTEVMCNCPLLLSRALSHFSVLWQDTQSRLDANNDNIVKLQLQIQVFFSQRRLATDALTAPLGRHSLRTIRL